MVALAALAVISASAATPATLRVCTFGGEGKCSYGYGAAALDALDFLSPLQGPSVVSCSCLARCDQGVVVSRPDGQMAEEVNSPRACAALLRDLGFTIDTRLVDAYSAALRADGLVEEDRDEEALTAYKRAFSLAIATGLVAVQDCILDSAASAGCSRADQNSDGVINMPHVSRSLDWPASHRDDAAGHRLRAYGRPDTIPALSASFWQATRFG